MSPARSPIPDPAAGPASDTGQPGPGREGHAAPTRRSWSRRLGRGAGATVLSAAAIAAAVLGARILQERAAAATPDASLPPAPAVVVAAHERQSLTTETRRLGVVEPARQVRMAFEIGGVLAQVAVQEGDRVRRGDLLARLDDARIRARIAELEAQRDGFAAQAELARRTSERQEKLRDKGFASDQRWDEARLEQTRLRAAIAQVEAGLRAARVDLARSELRAPFDGEVAARKADEGAILAAGAEVAELIESGRPQVRVGLPESAAAVLQPGRLAEVEIDGRRYPAAVASLRPDVDPATRTRGAVLDLLLPAGESVAFGRSVEVILDQSRQERGFWLPLGALREGEKGLWTVIVAVPEGVDESGAEAGPEAGQGGLPAVATARPEAVEVLHTDGERVYVRGTLREGDLVVAAGAHKLAPGLRLAPHRAAPRPPADQIAGVR